MADNNPNKRKCIEGDDGWRTTRGRTRGDTLVEIASNWFTRNYLIEQHLNGFLRTENAALLERIAGLEEANRRLQRSNTRFRTATTFLHDQLARAQHTLEFQRNLLIEIFNNNPSVAAVYQADIETEEEVMSDTEDEDVQFPRGAV